MRSSAAVVAAALACALAACSSAPAPPTVDDRVAQLAARRPVDWAAATMNATRNELLAVVATTAGGLTWAETGYGVPQECGPPLDGLGGQVRELGTNEAPVSVLTRWSAVLTAAKHSAASNGFTAVDLVPDEPRLRGVRFTAADGAYLELSTDAATTTVRAATGCHPVV